MNQNNNFIPFNCMECCHGKYNYNDEEWDCLKSVFTNNECNYYYNPINDGLTNKNVIKEKMSWQM